MEQHTGPPVIKVLNSIYSSHLRDRGAPAGSEGRTALPVRPRPTRSFSSTKRGRCCSSTPRPSGCSATSALIGEPLELLVPERQRELHVGLRHKYFAHPTTRQMGPGLELRVLRKDGRELPVEIRLGALQTETGVLGSAAVRDVSERKRLVAQLEQRGRLMDLAHDAIIVREPAGSRITNWNRAAEEIYGFGAEDARGAVTHELVGSDLR